MSECRWPKCGCAPEERCASEPDGSERAAIVAEPVAIFGNCMANIRPDRCPAFTTLRAALAELVACKDLKIEADKHLAGGPWTGGPEHLALLAEHDRRAPLAWAAARAALAVKEGPADASL